MPELTLIHFGLLAAMLLLGAILGWIIRSDRCAKEKIFVNANWQDQLESQQSEHNRLAEQNKSLMKQISQCQALQTDYTNRAKKLSESLNAAGARGNELEQQLNDAIAQLDRLRNNQQKTPEAQTRALKEKDNKIFRLSRELSSWQSRVPPLVERFQEKSREAAELETELRKTQRRLEDLALSDQTRIEPVDTDSLLDRGDASNEPIAVSASHGTSTIPDEVEEDPDYDHVEDAVLQASVDDLVSIDEFVKLVDMEDRDAVLDEQASDAVFSEGQESLSEDTGETSAFDAIFQREEAGNADAAEETPVSETVHFDESDEPDDLQEIKGIGPAIAQTLNELGVNRYYQIAEMSEYDIDRIAQQLKGFRSRIYREDWIGQARDLQYEKSNQRG
jgi:predicted flap endonuclease-1-like 5' DNA nuclease/seryl-tRNA synthetase